MNDISNARYIDPDHTLVEAVIDGKTYQQVGPGGPIGELIEAWIADGNRPTAYEAPVVDLRALKAELKARVDRAAEAVRLRFITPGAGQALVYEAKRTEVARWLAANKPTNPSASNYPWAAARAERLDVTIYAVLTEWDAQASAWAVVGIAIENVREAAKEAISTAADEAQANAALAGLTWPGA